MKPQQPTTPNMEPPATSNSPEGVGTGARKQGAKGVRVQRMVQRLTLPADVSRCFGGGCADRERCQRYLARNEDCPQLSYIAGGAFVEGVCIYRIEPPNNQLTRREAEAKPERSG